MTTAEAEFAYVPPPDTAAFVTEPAAEDAVTPATPALWQVRSGEMLRDALERWARRAGVSVVWLTDRRWRLDEDRAFEGTFVEATRALLFGLGHLPHPPAAELAADSLTVVHRLPTAATEDGS